MPGGDGTGPMGMGSMTGRAAGYCAGVGTPGFANPATGRGFAMSFGRGRGFSGGGCGWRNWFYATGLPGWLRFGGLAAAGLKELFQRPEPEIEQQALKNQAEALQSELDLIKKRLEDLETSSTAG